MNYINKERIKSALIATLLVTSLIQVGILWIYQSHRLPINFLSAFFSSREPVVSDNMAREDLFVPYRLVISNGETSHWIIDKKDSIYKTLWEEAKTYLSEITGGKIPSVQPDADWGEITTRAGFVFEFKTGIVPDLMKWFLDAADVSTGSSDVRKVMIIPGTVDNSSSEVFLCDNEGKALQYNINNYISPKSFQDILLVIENDKDSIYREYSTMRDSNLDGRIGVDPDVLYVVKPPEFWSYNDIQCTIPAKAARINELAKIMLGSEVDRYTQNIYTDGTIQFGNTDNIYKVFNDGIMYYNYLSRADASDKGSAGDAVMNVYKFISRVKKVANSKADIFLSGIEEYKSDTYILKFDYFIEGLPIYMNFMDTDGNNVSNAIIIEANSKQVVKCRWVLRDFSTDGKKKYNDRFLDLMKNYDIKFKQMQIKDISVGYVVKSASDKLLKPKMIIENKNNSGIQAIEMPLDKGG